MKLYTAQDRLVLGEYYRRHEVVRKKLLGDLFDKQIALILDPARRKTALCGRRGGKTHCIGVYVILTALANPGLTVPYIALTKGHARRLLWPILHHLNLLHDLKASFNETELTMTFPHGGKVWLTGADRVVEIEKLRGGAYPLVCLDESGSFGARLEYLIDDVLDAALEDYAGTILMVGSPGATCAGKFYAASTTEPGWSRHHWTVLDNPQFPRWRGQKKWRQIAQKWLEDKKKERGWDNENPIYLREWLGRWIRDLSSLVYRFVPESNCYESLPTGHQWQHILGMDLGYNDATSFAVIAYSLTCKGAYLVEDYIESGLNVTQVATKAKEFQAKYKPVATVADSGALGKMIVAEIRERHMLQIEPAEKKDKKDFIELFNDDLRTGKFFVRQSSHFAEQATVLQWDESKDREDERFRNDACFVGETMVHTMRGLVPIKDVIEGDYAMTRHGYRRVLAAWQSSPDADVVKLSLSTGQVLIGTPNHPVFLPDGTKCAMGALPYAQILTGDPSWPGNVHGPLVTQKEACGCAAVYNLTIQEHHEYFANGILVSNCDSVLYSWRKSRHYRAQEPPKSPEYGSKEYFDEQERELLRERQARVRAKSEAEWGE